jgi:hypothetical protein
MTPAPPGWRQLDHLGLPADCQPVSNPCFAAKKLFPRVRFGGMFSPMLEAAWRLAMTGHYVLCPLPRPFSQRFVLDEQRLFGLAHDLTDDDLNVATILARVRLCWLAPATV